MSVESISKVLNRTPSHITGTARLVLVGIANHDGDGGAWPSVATLARYAGVTPRNARAALRKLEDAGLIERVIQGGGNGQTPPDRRPNLYRFRWDGFDCMDGDGGSEASSREEREDAGIPPGRMEASPRGRMEASPEPSLEPSLEPSKENARDIAGLNGNGERLLGVDDPDGSTRDQEGFEDFWKRYPARRGKRVGKRAALRQWMKRTRAERGLIMTVALPRYVLFCESNWPRDAERWLNPDSRGCNFTDHEEWAEEWEHWPEGLRDAMAEASEGTRAWMVKQAKAGEIPELLHLYPAGGS